MSAWDSFRSGMNATPIGGALNESILGSPDNERKNKTMRDIQASMIKARPQMNEARMNAFNNQSLAFEPMQRLLAQMYGQQAVPDMDKMTQNPLGQDQMAEMYKAAGKPMPGSATNRDGSIKMPELAPDPNQGQKPFWSF